MIELSAGFYGRQSSDETNYTRQNQIKWSQEFIPTAEGWLSQAHGQPVRIRLDEDLIFFDRHVSGVVYDRPEYGRCKEMLVARQVPILLIYALDRLGRGDPFETIHELHYWRRNGVRVYSQSDANEATSPEIVSFLKTSIASSYAHEEWKRIRKRTLEGRFTAWEKDHARMSFGRRPRLGYHLDDDKHVIAVPEEAKIVNRIFDMVAGGLTYFEVARRLNLQGVPTATALRGDNPAARWSPSAVSRVINCEEYASGETFMDVNDGSETRHRVSIEVPVVVTPEKYRAAQRAVARRRRTRKRAHAYLLKGVLVCADCGQGIICTSRHYGCRGRVHARRWNAEACRLPYIPPAKLDPAIWQDVQAFVSRPDVIYDALEAQSAQQVHDLNGRLAGVEAAIERQRQARGRLALRFALEEFSPGEIRAARRAIDADLADLEREHAALQLSRAVLQQYEQQVDRFEELSQVDLGCLPHEGRAALVAELVERVEVARTETGIRAVAHYHLLDSGSISFGQTPDMITYRTEPLLVEL